MYINKIQQDERVCRYLFTAKLLSTYFGCPLHPSSEEYKIITATSGTGHSIWAMIFRQRGISLRTTLAEGRCPDTMTCTRGCIYSFMFS